MDVRDLIQVSTCDAVAKNRARIALKLLTPVIAKEKSTLSAMPSFMRRIR